MRTAQASGPCTSPSRGRRDYIHATEARRSALSSALPAIDSLRGRRARSASLFESDQLAITGLRADLLRPPRLSRSTSRKGARDRSVGGAVTGRRARLQGSSRHRHARESRAGGSSLGLPARVAEMEKAAVRGSTVERSKISAGCGPRGCGHDHRCSRRSLGSRPESARRGRGSPSRGTAYRGRWGKRPRSPW